MLIGVVAACRPGGDKQSLKKTKHPAMTPIVERLDDGSSITSIYGFVRSYSIGIDGQDNLYVPDLRAHNVVMFTRTLELVGAFDVRDGKWQAVSVPGKPVTRALPSEGIVAPHSVSFDGDRNMYITELKGHRVTKLSPDGLVITRIGENGELVKPAVSYIESDNYLYIGNYGTDQVMRYSLNGRLMGWLGATTDSQPHLGWRDEGTPVRGYSLGGLNKPHAARLGPDGNLYVVDTGNHRIVKFTHNGTFLGWSGALSSGETTNGWATDGTSALGSMLGGFTAPVELEFDTTGYMYITDMGNHRIVRMGLDGKATGWLGAAKGAKSPAQWRTAGEPQAGNQGIAFHEPYGIRVRNGKLYISDTSNQRIVIIDSTGLDIK